MERLVNGRLKQLERKIAKNESENFSIKFKMQIKSEWEVVTAQRFKTDNEWNQYFAEQCGGVYKWERISTVYSISDLARQIQADWKKPYFGAVPYIEAMSNIHGDINSSYFNDNAKSIVNYFLANAGTWRGDEARRIKAILKKLVS